jgi:DNA-binding GntR family transcriptional regulator
LKKAGKHMARKKPSRPRTKSEGLGGLNEFWNRYRDQRNAAEAVYLTLRAGILHGILQAGQPLGEIQLAAVFGRSRTPIREAILKLESERMAERVPRRGLVVAHITREEVLEVYAVREVLNGLAARLAAHGMLPTELDRLVWLNERFRAAVLAGDAKTMMHVNIEFHEAVCQASRNSLLQELTRRISERVQRFGLTTMAVPGRGLEAAAEHDALIAAVRARDPDAAERISRSHVSRARQLRIDLAQSAAGSQTGSSHATGHHLQALPAAG